MRCHTDLFTCCTGSQGHHRGDWYFPNGNALSGSGGGGDIYKRRDAQVVHLCRRNNAMSPSGIYRCDIETVAVNDNDNTITGETAYVGLYPPNEGIYEVYLQYLCRIHNTLATTKACMTHCRICIPSVIIFYIRRYHHT